MSILFAIMIGVLYGSAFFMMMRPSIFSMVIALILISHASNFFIFISGGFKGGSAPVISSNAEISPLLPDPLPQALILTAIVISFGMLAFALILSYRSFESIGTDNSDQMKEGSE